MREQNSNADKYKAASEEKYKPTQEDLETLSGMFTELCQF